MHADATKFALSAPASLEAALRLLAEEPGRHTPIAGGTEVMVAFGAGRLAARTFVSIQHLKELRFVRVSGDAIEIGAGTTFTDIRRSAAIARELPLLIEAASWTGTIANQNRATLGGNICNASPAADTPPALLAYGASVTLASASGRRTVPYGEFHLGYKKTALRAEELLFSVTVPLGWAGWRQQIRKVGTRNALAISKVALAGLARVDAGRIAEVRLGGASLADRPVRLLGTEAALTGRSVAEGELAETVRRARAALAREAQPIDDIRSTAAYRRAVAGNLVEGFVLELGRRRG